MTKDPNEEAIEKAVQDGFVVIDEANRAATINFDPNDPKLEIKRATGLRQALKHRGYKVHAPGLDRMGFKSDED